MTNVKISDWCTDFSKTPQDSSIPFLVKYYDDDTESECVTVAHIESSITHKGQEDNIVSWYVDNMFNEVVQIENAISWKPIFEIEAKK